MATPVFGLEATPKSLLLYPETVAEPYTMSAEATQSVWLQSSDFDIIEVDRVVAKRSLLIKDLLDDNGGEDITPKNPIPIATVNGVVLRKVVEWCQHHRDDPPLQESPIPSARLDNFEEWDEDFIQVDQAMLFEIILASNYLDIKTLLDMGCKTVANMIREKEPHEIRELFNIEDDLTIEEKERIERENAWINSTSDPSPSE